MTPLRPRDLVQPGNIDLKNRPIVENDDGSYSTVRTMTVGPDEAGVYANVPTVLESEKGKGYIASDDQAYRNFAKTGQHLGKYSNLKAALKAAESLHKDQDKAYRSKRSR